MRVSLIWTMIFSMTVLPTVAASAADSPETLKLQNVELSESGLVKGQLLDSAGKPIAKKVVEIRTQAGSVKHLTDADGRFVVSSKSGGNCALVVDEQSYACRLWTNKTAPPKSLTSFSVVYANGPVVRGQGYDDCAEGCDDGCGRLGGISKGQLLGLGLLAGAVVAIVLAADNDSSD